MTRAPTAVQLRIAAKLGIDVTADSETVAAARITTEVGEAIGDARAARPASERQIAFAESLGVEVSTDSNAVASAKISDALYQRNLMALARLKLKPGDLVRKRTAVNLNGETHELVEEAVVSSVQPSLRVFFKGGNGKGAWPSELEKL